MYGMKWAAPAVGAVLLLAGCSGGGGAAEGGGKETAAATKSAFGRKTVQGEINDATKAAGLPDSGRPKGELPASAPASATAKEKLTYRALACTAPWQWLDMGLPGEKAVDPAKAYDKAVAELTARGWQDEGRSETKPDPKSTSVQTVLTKQGWTLYARHHALKSMHSVSFTATEDACMRGFTPKEQEQLLEEEGRAPGTGAGTAD
ncbi:hypothetical protein LG634_30465 [Streptomyces bambusae]|uniref:hypothetical protein n=1 Tax=Streptomyces bambusae TaxID=1550616 RepID=UPI001CFF71F2|nr:hypothetical protein [Streptomyces bambusae]MCB5169119.1 hypothetical protein [Streptomyces bambusae]